ncbi:MAG: hypothetical protein NTX25_19000, partial [Proteobacteria bacterium]|nr:hypothetical protein [Pseudomonadota bacterium]
LPDEQTKLVTGAKDWTLPEGLSERSYIWLNKTLRKAPRGDWEKGQGLDAEASLSLSYKATPSLQSYIDGRVYHQADSKSQQAILEQGGVRYEAGHDLLLALGKERSRKAPGLLVAPSDFLYTEENLPGQKEQRAGLWQARVAYQETGRSLEALVLPYQELEVNGMPKSNSHWNGWALRGFYQFSNFDLQVSAGHLADGWHEGLSTQGIVGAFKLYAESGWSEKARSLVYKNTERGQATLVGTEYQAWDKWTLRAEYFKQSPYVDRADQQNLWRRFQIFGPQSGSASSFRPLSGESYVILSCSGQGLSDKVNVYITILKSLDDRSFLLNQRGEWLWDDHQVIGLGLIALSEGDQQQYALRPFDRQLSLDWKFIL